MRVFTNSARDKLLEGCGAYPRTLAVPGWHGYTLVAFTRAPADAAWTVESRRALGPRADFLENAKADARALAKRLGLAIPRDLSTVGVSTTYTMPFWYGVQVWVEDPNGYSTVLVSVFPDVVWSAHFPEVCGPLVAIVFWPPGAHNDRSRCVVSRVCLGADAWGHLDAAAAAFRARVCADAGEAPVGVRVTMSVSPLCARGATAYCERVSLPREDETWSAEVVRDADDGLARVIFAPK